MTEQFKSEIKEKKKSINNAISQLSIYWMDGKFTDETNHRIGRSLDYMNKAIDELDKLIK